MDRPDFRELVATKTADFPGKIVKGKRSKGFQIQNHNELLSHYQGAIGVKTGYTEAAKWTYVGAARRGDHTYVVTELGLSQPGWVPTTKLLNWAFRYGGSASPVGALVSPVDLPASSARSAVPGSGRQAQAASSIPLTARSDAARWVGWLGWAGAAGLLAAAAICGALTLGVVRRRAGASR
ncbi:MAG: hypothetical protein ACJ71T_14625 [Actinomycetales bacterium]